MKQDSRCWYTGVHVGQGGEAAAPVAWALRGDPTDYTAKLRGAATRREKIGGGARRAVIGGWQVGSAIYPMLSLLTFMLLTPPLDVNYGIGQQNGYIAIPLSLPPLCTSWRHTLH